MRPHDSSTGTWPMRQSRFAKLLLACCLLFFSTACHGLEPSVSPPDFLKNQAPSFVWAADYENGYHPFGKPWGELVIQGGSLEIIQDPTASGKGFVQRSTISADRHPPIEERPSILVYRLYPGIFFPFKPAPYQFSQDVWVSRELIETATHNGNQLVVGPDIFDMTPADGGKSRSAIQVVLNKDSLIRGKTFLRLYNKSSGGKMGSIVKNAPEFLPERWHRIKIFVGKQREIILLQDGVPVSKAKYPSGNRLGTVGGHPGLYAGRWLEMGRPLKGWMLVDNFEIRCW